MGEYTVVKCRLLRLASAIGNIHHGPNAHITLSGGKTLLGRDDDGLS